MTPDHEITAKQAAPPNTCYHYMIKSDDMTVNKLIEQYLDLKTNLAVSTKENYTHIYEKNIKDTKLGKSKVKDIKKMDIQAFYAYLFTKRNFCRGTIQLYQNILFPAFQMAVDNDIIRKNPCNGCMKEYTRGSMSSTKYPLTKEEQNNLLIFTKTDTIYSQYYPLLVFMLGTGCRISETLGMTWDNIDFEKKCVRVDHQVIYKKKDGMYQYYASETKDKTPRTIPLQDNVLLVHQFTTL